MTMVLEISSKDLVARYNNLAAIVGAKPVNRFASREVGLKRVERLEAEAQGIKSYDGPAQVADVVIQEAQDAALKAEMVEKYNRLANTIDADRVDGFLTVEAGEAALADLEARVQAYFADTVGRKKRQKVFSYPPKDELKGLNPGSLRAEARDLLLGGATLGRVEQLVGDWDVKQGKTPHRLEPRAYGLVRLLHTYVGYALREEIVGGDQVIFVMDQEAWAAWKKSAKA